jgi:ESCRT-II complex subunit VPS36
MPLPLPCAQLADFLAPHLEAARGVLTLPDVYCLFNRARGTELVSPDDLIKVRGRRVSAALHCAVRLRKARHTQACGLWSALRVDLRLRRFDSGVLVVQSRAHSDEQARAVCACTPLEVARSLTLASQVSAALEQLAANTLEGVCAADAAHQVGLTPAIARECLLAAEARGVLCRDDAPDGLRFFKNPWRSPE